MPFAIIDGDDVGNKVESHLLANNVTAFIETSIMITEAIESLVDQALKVPGVAVVSAGGDSILLQVSEDSVSQLSGVLTSRQRPEYFTFSVGVGATLRESFIALRMAKSSGKSKIVTYPEV
ncbi:mCpol domain-containing protein [Streptomyces sp. NPDC002855]|uniref:mCpol domain-containing protein n=1 Tax=Streptomyces sp. NPDC002855 TaxID=3154437 RepID=UPI003324D4C6